MMADDEILILYKYRHEEARSLAFIIAGWLSKRGMPSKVTEASPKKPVITGNPRMVMVLGGDGTILGVARKLAGRNMPIFGINLGKVGFLTCADPANWRERLEAALEGRAHTRECLALNWELKRDGNLADSGIVINDIVLGHGPLARLIRLEVVIEGEKMGTLRSDGLIICTSLGSSGYSVSAGGPLLYPEIEAIGLTPICSYQANVFPLVLPPATDVLLRVAPHTPECYLTLDGQECRRLRENDQLEIKGYPHAVQLLSSRASYYERLRARGFALES